jgi:hypothetical protein
MAWSPIPQQPIKPTFAPDLLARLKECGDRAHATLETLPKAIAREYVKQLNQLQATIEKFSKQP